MKKLRHHCLTLCLLGALISPASAIADDCGVVVTSTGTFMPNATPKQAPDVAFLDEDGAARSLSAFKGQPLVVNFWGTWCAPCVKEVPSLDRFIDEMSETDLEVLALAWEKKGGLADVKDFFARLGADHMIARLDDGGAAAKAFDIRRFPSTVLVGRDGDWIGTVVGGLDWDQGVARKLVQDCLHPKSQ